MGDGKIDDFNFFANRLKLTGQSAEKNRPRRIVLAHSRIIYFLFALVYLAFVVYGSLVPLDFHPRPLAAALRDFYHLRYLKLSVEDRADWVANILLYIPLAYLGLGSLAREGRGWWQVFLTLIVFCFCLALSVMVEFTQQFFPPRTVSWNDLVAEILGTTIGIVLWWTTGRRLGRFFYSVLSQKRSAAYAGSLLYSALYLLFSLFPFDFLVSADEFSRKLAGDYFAWMPSHASCGAALRCGAKLMAEAVAVTPLGFLLSFQSPKNGWALIKRSAWLGLWLGLGIESLQLLLASGVSLGVSVLTRILGVATGAAAGEVLKGVRPWPLLYLLAPWVPLGGTLYVALLFAVTLSGKGPLLSLNQGLDRVSEIYFMPFYYHYYTTEAAALASVISVTGMFLPLGILFWVWRVVRMRVFVARGAIQAGFCAASVSALLESSKLIFRSTHPDPTDVMIAAAAAFAGYVIMSVCTRASLDFSLPPDNVSAKHPSR